MKLVFEAHAEDLPGSTWAALFDRLWPAYRGWFLSQGIGDRPTYTRALAMLRRHMPEGFSWTRPEGGMFLWVSGPGSLDTLAVLAEAIDSGVAFVPGADFFPRGGGSNNMRLNFSNADAASIRDGIARLAAICSRTL